MQDSLTNECIDERHRQGRLDTSQLPKTVTPLGPGVRALITAADLKTQSRRDLVELAKQFGIAGWHSMKKDELIVALARQQRNARRRTTSAPRSSSSNSATNAAPTKTTSKALKAKQVPKGATPAKSAVKRPAAPAKTKPQVVAPPQPEPSRRVVAAINQKHEQSVREKDLSSSVLVSGNSARITSKQPDNDPTRDRIVLIVRDSYWLQATWEVCRASVQRAAASMAEHWHTARPIIRVLRITDGAGANATEQWVRDISIHGGVNTWYIDVDKPPSRFRVVVGYLSAAGKLFVIARSNLVQTPMPGACDQIEGHWRDIAEDYERIYALSGGAGETVNADLKDMFEERLQRPMVDSNFGAGADSGLRRDRDLPFNVDAELIVYGSTVPGASVTLAGEPVKLRADGSFTVRVDLPDKRQVLPVVACSRDGMRQRTTVVAVERNTKVMEPIVTDEDE